MRFVIWAPPYRSNSAGVRVLFRLCHLLNTLGVEAVVIRQGNPEWLNPILEGSIRDDDYIVYPDIVQDNPLDAKRVIRYMLYYPWAYFGGNRIKVTELCMVYHKYIFNYCQAACDYKLTEDNIMDIRVTEYDLFYPGNNSKHVCFYKGKGQEFGEFPLPEGSINLGQRFTREQLAEILRETKELYCTDANTILLQEAFLCGVEVFLVLPNKQVMQWFGQSQEEYKTLYDSASLSVERFVNMTKEFFNKEQ